MLDSLQGLQSSYKASGRVYGLRTSNTAHIPVMVLLNQLTGLRAGYEGSKPVKVYNLVTMSLDQHELSD